LPCFIRVGVHWCARAIIAKKGVRVTYYYRPNMRMRKYSVCFILLQGHNKRVSQSVSPWSQVY